MSLTGAQKKQLKGLAHHLKPVVLIGQKGITDSVIEALSDAFEAHELIKVKFLDTKDKDDKEQITAQLLSDTGSNLVGTIGHTVILFKRAQKTENQKIQLK
jgi:RNA-binding protein